MKSVEHAEASVGDMGGTLSHEYQLESVTGQDDVLVCEQCGCGHNAELHREDKCSQCGRKLQRMRTIEIAHTFLLGSHYSTVFGANFINEHNASEC